MQGTGKTGGQPLARGVEVCREGSTSKPPSSKRPSRISSACLRGVAIFPRAGWVGGVSPFLAEPGSHRAAQP